MLGKIFKTVGKAVSAVGKVPVLGGVVRAVPGVGAVIAGAELVGMAGRAIGGGRPPMSPPLIPQLGGGGIPPPMLPPPGGVPALPGGGPLRTITGPPTMGGMVRAGLVGAGRRLLPVAAGIAAWELIQSAFSSPPGGTFGDVTLPLAFGTQTVRPPKNYVLIRNPLTGEARLMRKDVAKSGGLWRPSKKPPISVGQMSALRKAASARKALARAEKLMRKACPPRKSPFKVVSVSRRPATKTIRKVA